MLWSKRTGTNLAPLFFHRRKARLSLGFSAAKLRQVSFRKYFGILVYMNSGPHGSLFDLEEDFNVYG